MCWVIVRKFSINGNLGKILYKYVLIFFYEIQIFFVKNNLPYQHYRYFFRQNYNLRQLKLKWTKFVQLPTRNVNVTKVWQIVSGLDKSL